ncbi:unnamed protein product [Durusdinium trenchii]
MVDVGTFQVQIVLTVPRDGAACLSQLPVGLGCSVWCEGCPGCDRAGSLSIYATELQLLKIPPDVKQITKVVEAVAISVLPEDVGSRLLCCSSDRLLHLKQLHQKDKGDPEYKRELRQLVFLMTGGMEVDGQISAPPSARQRKAKVSKVDMQFLDCMEESLKNLYEVVSDSWTPQSDVPDIPSLSADLPDASSARGALSRSEYFHGKKWPQIWWFLGRLSACRRRCNFSHVLDVGGGRGDLAIHIASTFDGVKVTVVDSNESSLKVGQAAASKRHIDIRFCNMDFATAAEQLPADIDFVVALHACGGLSDAALNFASCRQIPFMVCPCCHLKHEGLEPRDGWSSLCDFGVLGKVVENEKNQCPARAIEDSQSTTQGTEITKRETTETGSQILRRLAEIDRRDVSWRALNLIATLRLWATNRKCQQRITCKLAAFSQEYSFRNLVLIGERI